MAKVLISPIGAAQNGYTLTTYKISGSNRTFETPFISAALADCLKVDKIIFIGTAKSMWEEVYRYFTESSDGKIDNTYWEELRNLAGTSAFNHPMLNETVLNKAMASVDGYLKMINSTASGESKPIILKYGLNEEEMWENFNHFMKITDILKDGDELYLDVTHSFRSIPLFMYLMMDFIQTLNYKKITLKGLYYGMFEASKELGYTPVVDLKSLFEISQWIRGVYDFVNYGNGYLIGQLMEQRDANYAGMSEKVGNISELININYLTDLHNQIKSLFADFMNYEQQLKGAIVYIFPLLKNFVSRFSKIEKASEFQLELSKWYFDNRRYGYGYICLVESVLTKLCEVYGLNLTKNSNRNKVKNLFSLDDQTNDLDEQYIHYKDKIKEISDFNDLAEKYSDINQIRNRIAHASYYQKRVYSFGEDIDNAVQNYENIKRLLESDEINQLNRIIPIEVLNNIYENKSKKRNNHGNFNRKKNSFPNQRKEPFNDAMALQLEKLKLFQNNK